MIQNTVGKDFQPKSRGSLYVLGHRYFVNYLIEFLNFPLMNGSYIIAILGENVVEQNNINFRYCSYDSTQNVTKTKEAYPRSLL